MMTMLFLDFYTQRDNGWSNKYILNGNNFLIYKTVWTISIPGNSYLDNNTGENFKVQLLTCIELVETPLTTDINPCPRYMYL